MKFTRDGHLYLIICFWCTKQLKNSHKIIKINNISKCPSGFVTLSFSTPNPAWKVELVFFFTQGCFIFAMAAQWWVQKMEQYDFHFISIISKESFHPVQSLICSPNPIGIWAFLQIVSQMSRSHLSLMPQQ